nr:hypothetical protein [Ensifer sp. ZNC0028]
MSDEAAIDRERLIFKTLFPTIAPRWPDYAAAHGLDRKDLRSVGAWEWRNRLGAAQAFWAHENAERDVFVTTDENFTRLPYKAEFSGAVIMTPTQAVETLNVGQWPRLRLRTT